MWGAVIGDLAGSIYEYGQYKHVSYIDVGKNLIPENSFFSDDTIMTVAIYDAILHGRDYERYLRAYGENWMDYTPKVLDTDHFHSTFGGRFSKWIKNEVEGDSTGNGAMMRISGVGKMFDTEAEVVENAVLATKPSHNSEEAIECAQKIALIIYYAKLGMNKNDIMECLGIEKLLYTPFTSFNKTCSQTINNCLYAVFSSCSFENALRRIISFGGDTDTNGAIVGSMAEMIYGIPEHYITKARKKIPQEFVRILDRAYDMKRK